MPVQSGAQMWPKTKSLTYFKYKIWANEMAQLVEALASEPEDLSSIPRNHMIGDNQVLQVVL